MAGDGGGGVGAVAEEGDGVAEGSVGGEEGEVEGRGAGAPGAAVGEDQEGLFV